MARRRGNVKNTELHCWAEDGHSRKWPPRIAKRENREHSLEKGSEKVREKRDLKRANEQYRVGCNAKMQNVRKSARGEAKYVEKVPAHDIIGNITSTTSTPQSTDSTPTKSETFSENPRLMSETSESEDECISDSEVESFMIDQEFEDDPQVEAAKFLLNPDEDRTVDPETQARLEALLQAAGIGQLTTKDGKALGDPEVLRRLTSSVSCALDEAAAALTRMRSDNQGNNGQGATSTNGQPTGSRPQTQGGASTNGNSSSSAQQPTGKTSLVEACTDGDVGTVKKLLTEGRSVHETSEEGESLLSLASSAGYFELAQVLLAMHANVEDRGIKGECTPLMESASAGHLDIVRLLVHHGADVNAQSTSGNTPLMYACAGGHTDVVKFLLENGANVEDHNENGHTPLMEAASAGHVGLAKILLQHGAGINTHSNEFKESALTLACYKGHLDMVRFLLEAGADQEHKTDEMHTALMEASMDGHVEVARLLLDSGAQVNMPTDSFESPLTLAACGGHVDLAMLLIERGANIEEVNDEGYTPLMEAAREGHEEMVHLLLGQGANINAQTDETQETALTLACCGGFTEVADILLKGGADIELGASTPLMEAAQEGHLDLVRFLLEYGANVNAVTQTNDTALTYACENGHTDVADLLLQYNSDLEHESEGGRTPLMKACRAGHLCTVQFLISKGANVRKQTTNNDHTPLSLACAGGHLAVVELLLQHNADPNHKLKDNSTMLIEAAKGGHTNVVQLLLDFPHSMQPIMFNQHGQPAATSAATMATNLSMLPGQVGNRESPLPAAIGSNVPPSNVVAPQPSLSAAILQEVPEAVRIAPLQIDMNSPTIEVNNQPKSKVQIHQSIIIDDLPADIPTPTLSDMEEEIDAMEFLKKEDPNNTLIEYIKNRKKFGNCKQKEQILEELNVRLHINKLESQWVQKYSSLRKQRDPEALENRQKRQILEELHRVEQELQGKQQQQQQAGALPNVFHYTIPHEGCPSTQTNALAEPLNFDLSLQQQKQGIQVPLLSNSTTMGYAINSSNLATAANQQQQQPIQVPYFTGLTGGGAALSSPTGALKLTMGNDSQTSYPHSVPADLAQQALFFSSFGGTPGSSVNSIALTSSSSMAPLVLTSSTSSVELSPLVLTSSSSSIELTPDLQVSMVSRNDLVSSSSGGSVNLASTGGGSVEQAPCRNNLVSTGGGSDGSSTELTSCRDNKTSRNNVVSNGGSIDLTPCRDNKISITTMVPTSLVPTSSVPKFTSVAEVSQSTAINDRPKVKPIKKDGKNLRKQQQQAAQQQHQAPSNVQQSPPGNQQQHEPQILGDQQQQGLGSNQQHLIVSQQQQLQLVPGNNQQVPCNVQQVPGNNQQLQLVPGNNPQLQLVPGNNQQVQLVPGNNQQVQLVPGDNQQVAQQQMIVGQQQQSPAPPKTFNLFADQQVQMFRQLQANQQGQVQQQQQQAAALQFPNKKKGKSRKLMSDEALNVLHYFKEDQQESLLTASILQQFHNSLQVAPPVTSPQKTRLEAVYDPSGTVQENSEISVATTNIEFEDFQGVEDVVQSLEVQPYPTALDENMIASLTAAQQVDLQAAASGTTAADMQRVEYFAVPTSQGVVAPGTAQVPVHALYPYDILANAGMQEKQVFQAGFQAGYSLSRQERLACSNGTAESLVVGTTNSAQQQQQQFIAQPSPQPQPPNNGQQVVSCGHIVQPQIQTQLPPDQQQQQQQHHCQHQPQPQAQNVQQPNAAQQQQAFSNHVQAATQTSDNKKIQKISEMKFKRGRPVKHHNNGNVNILADQHYKIDHNSAITQYNTNQIPCPNSIISPCMDVDSETESNHDTALTLACAGGHEELVELLISRGADIEHRDKKGFTPLILAATAGHEKVVEILLNNNADIEAQSERTKDTPLSLACSGGRYEVVELLLNRGANKEHRNVSDYTPLSLAASGGYVNIIKLLLSHGAEINSRTGSKLGISPLMLAAMNGHTAAVKLLLDMGSDINAQIETNRNTALTLACFQGRHEVVSLLLDRKANVEHRAKTGLTPLMEAASGGYVDVGRVLLDKGADVNATPVPSSRDTALTIAADKGHVRFVELLLVRGAQVEVKNKKGNSPLWLAANGGHLPVVEMLYKVKADIDSQDNRKVSCLMAAFRKGHVKVVKWMVLHVTQFPSDQEMMRYIATISDKELLEKCHDCVKIIRAAKETQAARANKNATILLEELESEKSREESKKLAAAKRRERKKKKRLEKKEERRKLLEENQKNENYDDKDDKNEKDDEDDDEEEEKEDQVPEVSNTPRSEGVTEEGDSGIDANSQGSCSSNDIKTTKEKRKNKKNKKSNSVNSKKEPESPGKTNSKPGSSKSEHADEKIKEKEKETKPSKQSNKKSTTVEPLKLPKSITFEPSTKSPADRDDFEATGNEVYVSTSKLKKSEDITSKTTNNSPKSTSKREEGWKEVVRKSSVQTVSESSVKKVSVPLNAISRVIGRGGSNINAIRTYTGAHIEVEKQGKGQGERIITIKGSGDTNKQAYSLITALIKDPEMDIMSALSKTQKVPPTTTTLWDKTQIATKKNAGKVQAPPTVPASVSAHLKTVPQSSAPTTTQTRFTAVNSNASKYRNSAPISAAPTRGTAPRLVAQAEKILQAAVRMPTSTAPASRTTPAKVITTSANQTFAAKLTDSSSASILCAPVTVSTTVQMTTSNSVKPSGTANNRITACSGASTVARALSPQPSSQQGSATPVLVQRSPTKTARPPQTGSAPPLMQQVHNPPIGGAKQAQSVPAQLAFGTLPQSSQAPTAGTTSEASTPRVSSSTPNPVLQQQQEESSIPPPLQPTSEYTLFYTSWNRRDAEQQKPVNFAAVTGGASNQAGGAGHKFLDQDPPIQVDASKAPGYRGGVSMCSPVSSKASSSSTTPPNMSANNSFQNYQEPAKTQNPLPPIGSRPQVSQSQTQNQPTTAAQDFMAFMDLNKAAANILNFNSDNPLLQTSFNPIQGLNFSQPQQQPQQPGPVNMQPTSNMSRLNPKAPEYSAYGSNPMQNKNAPQLYNGFQQQMNVPQQNNMFAMKGMDNFHRGGLAGTSSSTQNRSWVPMPQPFTSQSEQLISGLAGMTIQNLQAKFHSAEQHQGLVENGAELGIVHNSPNMSPNMPNQGHGMHPEGHFGGMEDRKPQPIGTERARKSYNASGMEPNNWTLTNEKPAKWGGGNLAEYGMRPPPMYGDDSVMDFPRPIQMDNFMNQPPFVNYQPPMGGIRHDFIPDMPKLDLSSWDNSRPLSDLQDKPHGWTNQWNK